MVPLNPYKAKHGMPYLTPFTFTTQKVDAKAGSAMPPEVVIVPCSCSGRANIRLPSSHGGRCVACASERSQPQLLAPPAAIANRVILLVNRFSAVAPSDPNSVLPAPVTSISNAPAELLTRSPETPLLEAKITCRPALAFAT